MNTPNIEIVKVFEDTLACESILRKAPDGSLILICQCGDTKEPAPGNRVYAFSSYDGGKTWTSPLPVRKEDGQAVYCTEVRVENGSIIAYLSVHNGNFIDWKCETAVSRDNGRSWTPGKSIIDSFGFVRGGITLSNGDTLVPCQMYDVTPEHNRYLKENGLYVWHSFYRFPADKRVGSVKNTVFIRENGQSDFHPVNGPEMKFDKYWIWSEPTIAETSPGRLLMILRSCCSGFLWKSVSYDYGRTWSEAEKTDIPSPSNKSKLLSLDNSRIALIHTPNGTVDPTSLQHRHPLEVWISDDGGESWGTKLSTGITEGCCSYPDGFYDEENGRILFSFEFNRKIIYYVSIGV